MVWRNDGALMVLDVSGFVHRVTVVDLKFAHIRRCTSSASGFRRVHNNRRTLYLIRVRQCTEYRGREMAFGVSAGFGDVLGDWFGRNKSGERQRQSTRRQWTTCQDFGTVTNGSRWFNGYCKVNKSGGNF